MKTITILAALLLCAIAFADSITQQHEAGTPWTDHGATATDNVDGNITARIVATGTVNPAALGTYSVTYNVKDLAGNAATPAVRTVVVKDTIPPVIALKGLVAVRVQQGTPYVDAGATALDSFAGALTPTMSGSVDTSKVGNYVLVYGVSDPSGNPATPVTRTVTVFQPADTTPPVITITK